MIRRSSHETVYKGQQVVSIVCCRWLFELASVPAGEVDVNEWGYNEEIRHLEVNVDNIKSGTVLRQLLSNICRSREDRHQSLPLLLHVRPRAQDKVDCSKFSLPGCHLV